MGTKIKDFIEYELKNDRKRVRLLVFIGFLAIALLFLSGIGKTNKSDTPAESESINYTEYTEMLENRLTTVISSIDGVGKCRVMITLENTSESVYAVNRDSRLDNSVSDTNDEYVIYDSDKGKRPVLIKEYFPKVQGVTVVCSGGDNSLVREKIISAVTALFNIPSNRVSVSRINE